MSYSISTLLTRNLHDVFGENDPKRRRAAIDEIFTEDCVFYEPGGAFTVATTRSIASRARGTAGLPPFISSSTSDSELPSGLNYTARRGQGMGNRRMLARWQLRTIGQGADE